MLSYRVTVWHLCVLVFDPSGQTKLAVDFKWWHQWAVHIYTDSRIRDGLTFYLYYHGCFGNIVPLRLLPLKYIEFTISSRPFWQLRQTAISLSCEMLAAGLPCFTYSLSFKCVKTQSYICCPQLTEPLPCSLMAAIAAAKDSKQRAAVIISLVICCALFTSRFWPYFTNDTFYLKKQKQT